MHMAGDVYNINFVRHTSMQTKLTLRLEERLIRRAGATAIVTRDAKGFAGASLSLYDPAELLRLVQAAR